MPLMFCEGHFLVWVSDYIGVLKPVRLADFLGQFEPEAVEEDLLMRIRLGHTAEADATARGCRQDDVVESYTSQFFDDRSRSISQATGSHPLLEGLPHHIRQEREEDVGLHSIFELVPDRAQGQFALAGAES